ncbi:glycolate oxidase [Novimethylophilus kurashikiensis]|uniref:Glycolate oxidase n=1 Tax=Novimethylophilus kurashikiensis TaxID=1825523 RepID=A0A2R5FH61_9PROT|nr:FAD-linked oxidase C-terminal domain-containing protein [Novimethylophilus kurashikiensis]GBG15733.1 glycolate oxidase [Novimethylophilus kurashikiensis]
MNPSRHDLIRALQAFLPDEAILADEEALRPYECDGLSAFKQLPLLVAMPETVAQVQQVMRICHQFQVPVVARGAGTGLSAGALPHSGGVLLSLAKFNRILDIDVQACTARVQPGVRNLAISQAVVPYGLFYAPDPSSQVACSIGGNVAENSGGVHCLKYGLTVHNVLKLEVITAEGELLTIGSDALDSPGYDLLALIHGSEGMLGIVVEVTVKLLPLPEAVRVLLVAFDSVEKAGQAVGDIIAAGIVPAGLEMMDNPAIRAAEDFAHAGYPTDAAAILLCEIDGGLDEVASQVARVRGVLMQSDATEVRLAVEESDRQKLWKGRKSAFPAIGRLSPDYYCMDGTIPRKALPQVLHQISELSKEFNLPVANVFHAGDGNLHPLILYDAGKPGELHRAEQLGGRILELCVKVGGTITGEHGVGVEKLDQMCVQFAPLELAQFHAIKAAFDPEGLLNPGKAVPELHRCAELGAMHVHQGQLAHPELERF